MRAALYARYSTDYQRESSITDQFRNCEAWAGRNKHRVTLRFQDQGISGSTRNRPGYKAMLEAATQQAFDVLLVDDLSRLSRDDIEMRTVIRDFQFRGIRVVGVSDGFDTADKNYKLQAGLRGIINETYIDDHRAKVQRGMEGAILNGYSAGGRVYGYRSSPIHHATKTDAYGNPVIIGARRVIEPAEAEIIVRIYEAYAAGQSPRAICGMLNQEGAPSPRGKSWSPSAIHGRSQREGGILKNPLYHGQIVWNRTKWLKHPRTGDRMRQDRPKEEWREIQEEGLRILPEPLWQAVQQRLAKQSHKTTMGPPPRYLLSGLLKCGVCGSSYTKASHGSYACAGHRDKGEAYCTNWVRLKQELVENKLLGSLKQELLTEQAIDLFISEITKALAEYESDALARGKATAQQLQKVEAKIANVIAAIEQGIITASTKETLLSLEQERATLQATLEQKPEPSNVVRMLPNAVDLYRQRVENLNMLARDNLEQAREIISEITGGRIVINGSYKEGVYAEINGNYTRLFRHAVISGVSDLRYHTYYLRIPLIEPVDKQRALPAPMEAV